MEEEYSHPVYQGQHYVYEINKFMSWAEQAEWYKGYNAYCSRMWLDYCDENKHPGAICLTKQQYINKWAKWLAKRYMNGDGFA